MVATTRELHEQRTARIAAAVALEKPDRVPVIPLGDAFAANVMGVSLAEFCTKPQVAYPTIIAAFTSLGDIDGIQHASYSVSSLSTMWLSKVLWPGRDLPENELWQVAEAELMSVDDYDAIAAEGYGAWLERFIPRAGLEEEFSLYREHFVPSLPAAFAAWEAVGIPVFAPVMFTIPFETFCGGRSMRQFILDLYRIPDRVEAAMRATMPYVLDSMRRAIRALGVSGCRLGGWRSASEFLAPKLWERFVFPYYQELCAAVIAEGVTPVFHFDSDWTRDLERFKAFPRAACVLSLDGATDIYKAKEILGDHMCLMGDVPPPMLSLGTPDEVHEYCSRLIRDLGPTGFILAQGCDIPPDAKPENVAAMIAAATG
jgi:hypothetical protein